MEIRMRFKKLICLGLSIAMLVSAAGCGNSGSPAAEAPAFDAQTSSEAEADSAKDTAGAVGEEESSGQDSAAEAGTASTEAASAEEKEISPEDISVTWEDSHVYSKLTLGSYDTIVTYGVKGYEDVPFIKASDYLEILFEGMPMTSLENGIMTVTVNGAEAVIDPAADTIRFDNTSRFRSSGEIDGAILDKSEYNVVTYSAKNKSVQTDVKPVTVSLKEYHMPVIPYEDDILMPFLALQNTFGSVMMSSVLAYNGKDYYNAFSAEQFISGKGDKSLENTPYIKALYTGPFSEKDHTTQAYADYAYYSTCLQLDLTFGHKEEKGITTFDEYFTRMNAKEAMRSTKTSLSLTTEFMLFNYLFDSMHDSVFSMNTVFGRIDKIDQAEVEGVINDIRNSEIGQGMFEEDWKLSQEESELSINTILGALLEKGLSIPEIVPLIAWTGFFSFAKPEEYGNERLDYAGDTAVIYFNAFKENLLTRSPSYYLDPMKPEDESEDNFAFFYNCFEDIKTHDEVKNVVINICDNGGGSAAALLAVLGFLSEDGEVKISDMDMLAGNYREEYYHVDTNLDGICDDQDGFGGQYDFYILCSGSSYSCGNALPYFAQKNGLAKIIGTKPGGGDCVVGSFIDAYGHCAAYSGMLKLGIDDGNGFVSNEKTTDADLNMVPSIWDVVYAPWYDPEGIADAVHQYQNGAAELVYTDIRDEERLSDFLTKLFEMVAAKLENQLPGEEASEAGATAEAAESAEGAENP